MLSSRIVSAEAVTGPACCRLAAFHQGHGLGRARRYPSDTTDAQWALIDPLLPHPERLAVTRSLCSNSRMPSPTATTWIAAFAVGTFGRMRKMPLLAAVSLAVKVSVSPVNRLVRVIGCVPGRVSPPARVHEPISMNLRFGE